MLMACLILEHLIPLHHVHFARKLEHAKDKIEQNFRTILLSRQVLLSNYWLRHVPIIIASRDLFIDLVILKIDDYDVILGNDSIV